MMRFGLIASLSAAHFASASNVLGFVDHKYPDWQKWDWDVLTHLASWGAPSDDVRAKAKENNVKLFMPGAAHAAPDDWTDDDKRANAVAKTKKAVDEQGLDGTFFDYEGNNLSDDQKKAYTQYVKEVAEAIAPKEVFVCVGGRPNYEWRNYDYEGLAKHSSFLFIMGYDMHFYDDYTCVQKGSCSPAEAGLKDLKAGVKDYLDKVSADKLLLGLPWYGQRYTQVAGVLFNQGQVDYEEVEAILYGDKQDRKKSHTLYDNDKDMAWKLICNGACIDGKKGGVIWYDDETTLAPKYQLAADNDLYGVGVWQLNSLDHSGKYDKQMNKMWDALRSYRQLAMSNATMSV
jgi:spore germination protein YaaH